MKKILITHVSNTLNYGSAMMAINLIYYLRKRMPEVEIWCECDQYHLDRLKKASGYQDLNAYQSKPVKRSNMIMKIYRFLSGNREDILHISYQFDLMIVLGGDDLSEVYQSNAMSNALYYYHINRRKCKVILLNQNIGPYTGIYKLINGLLLHKLIISTRDQRNYEYLTRKLRLKKVQATRDLAFLPLPNQEETIKEMHENFIHDRYIVVVPSGVFVHYGLNQMQAVKVWASITNLLLSKYKSHIIVLLGHVLAPPTSNDRQIIDPLSAMFKNDPRVITVTNVLQPIEARAIIANSELVFTGRMHAAVSALATGTIPLAFAYSEKYFGVVARGFDIPELVIDCRNGVMNQAGFINTVQEHIQFINRTKTDLESKIRYELTKTRELANKNIDIVIQHLTK
ncbi:MAG: polysaccharide pyruvyl transferase family protein [Bacteroidota bacterium]|nr:polysaccharide pyruvyl transferase family protein [Bacteroidota bacterium]